MRISDWSSDVCSSDLDGVGDPGGDDRRKDQPIFDLRRTEGKAGAAPFDRRQRRHRPRADLHPHPAWRRPRPIGRASGRERVCQYVSISVGGGSLKKKNTKKTESRNIAKVENKK